MVWSGCDLRCGRVHTRLCQRRDTQSERAAIDDQLRDVCHEQVYHLELMYIVFVNGDPLQVIYETRQAPIESVSDSAIMIGSINLPGGDCAESLPQL